MSCKTTTRSPPRQEARTETFTIPMVRSKPPPPPRETTTKPPPHREAKCGDVGNAVVVYDDANGEHHGCRAITHGDETAIAPIRGDNETAAASRGEDGVSTMLPMYATTPMAGSTGDATQKSRAPQDGTAVSGGRHCLGRRGAPHDGEAVPAGEGSILSGTYHIHLHIYLLSTPSSPVDPTSAM